MKPDPMTSLNVSLPASLKGFVEEQVASGGFGTASEYVRHLIREARRLEAEEGLERLLLAGLDSGPPIELDDAYWRRKRDEVAPARRPATRR